MNEWRRTLRFQRYEGRDLTRIGEGELGAKADGFVAHTEDLRAVGFRTVPRFVLVEGHFDPLVRGLGLGDSLRDAVARHRVTDYRQLREAITAARYPRLQAGLLGTLFRPWKSRPLAVRSSGAADARGSATYLSRMVTGAAGIIPALLEVIASNFTPDAYVIRQTAGGQGEMGVIIEPIVGTWFDGHHYVNGRRPTYFGPMLSGFAYTSTAQGPAEIGVVPGLGGGVEQRDVERMTRAQFLEYATDSQYGGSDSAPTLFAYRHGVGMAMLGDCTIPYRDSALLGARDGQALLRVQMPLLNLDVGRMSALSMNFDGPFRPLDDLSFLPLFDMLEALERRLGAPQYLEWALNLERDAAGDVRPQWYANQIAATAPHLDLAEWGDLSRAIGWAHTVKGVGRRRCNGLALVMSLDDIERLRAFDGTHQDYILVYNSLLMVGGRGLSNPMGLEDIRNAAAVYEIPFHQHGARPEEHWGGKIELSGKWFGVMDPEAAPRRADETFADAYEEAAGAAYELPDWLARLVPAMQQVDGLRFYPRLIDVISRPAQNRAYLLPGGD